MKLLMISNDPHIFDTQSEVARRQIELATKYEEVYIISFSGIGPESIQLSQNCFAIPTRSTTKFGRAFDAIRIGRRLIEDKGITHITCQDPFLTGLAGESLKKRCHIPLEIQIHTDIGSPYFARSLGNKIRLHVADFVLPKADTIRVVSHKIKNYLVHTKGIKETKITVRPIPVDTEKIKNTPITVDLHTKYPQFSHIILMASRLEVEKQIPLVLDALVKVKVAFPKAGLIIVGKGSEEQNLRQKVNKLSLTDAVVFEPWTDQPTLTSFYKTADVFVLVSLFEGYGMTLVEAHAAGCPIVSTDVGVAQEVGARIVDRTALSVAEGVIEILHNKEHHV